ncbi:MAG: DUF1844 domain-containing protein [Acidobacteria bacterium]|nr:DUF1844 domain-containing protein [Acidobacteriota bacterium]MCA1610882.1 DUF1844 domain-containing protein [Acidobacteriota bacterium]MCA1617310.1 DUF1844 domain-containing protein [Acidobacteriota bacterium]
MAEKEEKPIRVVDRRMFTSEGELRPDFEPEESPPEKAAPPPPPPPPAGPASPGPEVRSAAAPSGAARPRPPSAPSAPPAGLGDEADEDPGGDGPPPAEPLGEFIAIVRSLATTAYSALGLLADPTGARHREPAVARQMIDWLTVLESKTRNNLSFEESDFLSRVLYELRLAFVEVTRPAPR